MRVLDLFSGTGSATQPWVECPAKHTVVRVDIAGKPTIRADVRHLPLNPADFDFIWASPPCDDFVDVPWHAELRNPARGKELWDAVSGFASIIENVRGAQRYFGKADYRAGSRYLWTKLDLGTLPKVYGKSRLAPSPERKMLRSMIPRPLADAVHQALCPEAAAAKEAP